MFSSVTSFRTSCRRGDLTNPRRFIAAAGCTWPFLPFVAPKGVKQGQVRSFGHDLCQRDRWRTEAERPAQNGWSIMTKHLEYGTTAKVLHSLTVVLLIIQYMIGWLMPDIHRDMKPGDMMTLHISIGITILSIILIRFFWRLTHPVEPDPSLPNWQRQASEGVHWLL